MTSTTTETENPAAQLPFAKPLRDGCKIFDLWAIPTSNDYTTGQQEGRMRARAVLELDMPGASPSDKAHELGELLGRMAFYQFSNIDGADRHRVSAIANFWTLIGELAAAYVQQNKGGLDFAARAALRRTVREFTNHTRYQMEEAEYRREAARKAARTRARNRRKANGKAAPTRKAVRS